MIQDLLVRRQFSLIQDNRTNVNVEAWCGHYNICYWFVCVCWCLTPLSVIFQLYRGGQFCWWRKPEDPINHQPVASHWQILSHNVVHLALIEIWTYNISGDRHWLHVVVNPTTIRSRVWQPPVTDKFTVKCYKMCSFCFSFFSNRAGILYITLDFYSVPRIIVLKFQKNRS